MYCRKCADQDCGIVAAGAQQIIYRLFSHVVDVNAYRPGLSRLERSERRRYLGNSGSPTLRTLSGCEAYTNNGYRLPPRWGGGVCVLIYQGIAIARGARDVSTLAYMRSPLRGEYTATTVSTNQIYFLEFRANIPYQHLNGSSCNFSKSITPNNASLLGSEL
jgi:hypothetical protein